jgi:hypothetical protein
LSLIPHRLVRTHESPSFVQDVRIEFNTNLIQITYHTHIYTQPHRTPHTHGYTNWERKPSPICHTTTFCFAKCNDCRGCHLYCKGCFYVSQTTVSFTDLPHTLPCTGCNYRQGRHLHRRECMRGKSAPRDFKDCVCLSFLTASYERTNPDLLCRMQG